MSKIEKELQQLKREQIPVIAEVFNAPQNELLTLWLADKLMGVIKDDPLADEVLKSVSKN